MPLTVSELAIYPLKSCKAVTLQSAKVNLSGLEFDRRYMLIDEQGMFVTARNHPTLTLIEANIAQDKLLVSHPDQAKGITLQPANFSCRYADTEIWENKVQGQLTEASVDTWFSELLQMSVRLVYFGEQSERFTSRRPDRPVAFADGYPFLLTTQASLQELNSSGPQTNEMARFRPNIVISGNQPFAEDSWKRIRIGGVIFENVKPCERCIFTTLDPVTAERSKKGEPLKTLAKFRLINGEGVTFGVNLIAENEGCIQVGDTVEIIEYQEPHSYADKR
ncbi:MOSC domain protein [Marinomonas aquimarina]|uniref:MOSC domain protein n=1 Tax=Marinomonas aquimarina TaxID=295068 RepID=A0A1A8TH04_9GAMM|nr:MOSC domain-containing protein [Marinomonas aquimarina]SBS31319.1 MOSC domain protein [Marinomonas aquimarina]